MIKLLNIFPMLFSFFVSFILFFKIDKKFSLVDYIEAKLNLNSIWKKAFYVSFALTLATAIPIFALL